MSPHRPNSRPICISRPKPTQMPNNKRHAKKDSNGFVSRGSKSSWASYVILMG